MFKENIKKLVGVTKLPPSFLPSRTFYFIEQAAQAKHFEGEYIIVQPYMPEIVILFVLSL